MSIPSGKVCHQVPLRSRKKAVLAKGPLDGTGPSEVKVCSLPGISGSIRRAGVSVSDSQWS